VAPGESGALVGFSGRSAGRSRPLRASDRLSSDPAARSGRSISISLAGSATLDGLVDEIEREFPPLIGTIRDPSTGRRRPLLRFFVGQDDLSDLDPTSELPAAVLSGREPFVVVGAIAGG
jgi:molybdopterin synthase sulfur carrier subunit